MAHNIATPSSVFPNAASAAHAPRRASASLASAAARFNALVAPGHRAASYTPLAPPFANPSITAQKRRFLAACTGVPSANARAVTVSVVHGGSSANASAVGVPTAAESIIIDIASPSRAFVPRPSGDDGIERVAR